MSETFGKERDAGRERVGFRESRKVVSTPQRNRATFASAAFSPMKTTNLKNAIVKLVCVKTHSHIPMEAKMNDWNERSKANVEKLANALRRACDEHGSPNGFYPRELWIDYGAPHQLVIGHMLRNTYIKNVVEQKAGVGYIEYGTAQDGSRRISIGGG